MEPDSSIAPLSKSEAERISKYVRDAQEHIYSAQGQIYKAQGCLNDISNFLSARSCSEAKTTSTLLDNIATTTEAQQENGAIMSRAHDIASSEATQMASGSVPQLKDVEAESDDVEKNNDTDTMGNVNDRRSTRPSRYSTTQMTDEQHAFLRSQLNYTKRTKHAMFFLKPVDPVVLKLPTYPSVIKQPMDLGTIETKLKSKEYASVQSFVDDVQLIVDNTRHFNGPHHVITHAAYNLMVYVQERLKKYAITRKGPRGNSRLQSE